MNVTSMTGYQQDPACQTRSDWRRQPQSEGSLLKVLTQAANWLEIKTNEQLPHRWTSVNAYFPQYGPNQCWTVAVIFSPSVFHCALCEPRKTAFLLHFDTCPRWQLIIYVFSAFTKHNQTDISTIINMAAATGWGPFINTWPACGRRSPPSATLKNSQRWAALSWNLQRVVWISWQNMAASHLEWEVYEPAARPLPSQQGELKARCHGCKVTAFPSTARCW